MNIKVSPQLKKSILELKEKKYKDQDSAIKNALQDLTNTLDLSDDEILKRAEVLKDAIEKKTFKVLKELEDECMKHPRYYSKKDPLPSEVTELRFWHIPETVKMWETIYYLNDKILQETIHTKKTFWEILDLVLNKKKSELNEILTTLVPDNQTALWEEWFDIKSINSAVLPTEKKTEEKTDDSWDAQSSWRSSTTEDFDKDLLDFFAPKNSTDGGDSFPSVGPDAISREEGATNEWEEEDISKPGSAYNRIKYLKQILDEKKVPFEYRLAIIWTNTPEMSREQSYAVIRIEGLNRTVLINNSYGEATYVVTWILDIEDLITFTKKDYQEDQNAVRVRFFSSNPGLWGSQMSEALFLPINKKLKNHIKKQEEAELETKKEAINNEKKREEITKFFLKNYGTKIEITKENEKDYTFPEEESNGLNIFTGEKNEQLYIFTEGEERNVYTFTEEDKEKLIMMETRERKDLKITVGGKLQGLQAIAGTFWLKEGEPRSIQKDREKLLSEIIKGGIKSKKEIFKAKFIERLESKLGKNIESFTDEDLEKLIMMTTEERNKAFEITVWGESQGLWTTAKTFWLKGGDPRIIQKDREELISEVIWKKIKSKKEIFKAKFIECLESKFGKNIESFTDEDLEKLVIMTGKERNKAFEIIVWGESQSLNKIATACWRRKENPTRKQEDREKLLSEIIWEKIKSKKELFKKYFIKDFPTAKEAKEKLAAIREYKRREYKIFIQGKKVKLKGIAEAFWVKGDPIKDLEVLEKLIDTIWTYEPPKEKSLSLAKDSLQAHHCELNEETLLEEVNNTNTDEGAKVLE